MLTFSIIICGTMASFPIIYLISSFLSSKGRNQVRTKTNSGGLVSVDSGKRSESSSTLAGEAKRASPVSSKIKTSSKTVPPRSSDPLWKERGWQKKGNKLEGYYRTKYGSYEGEIKLIDPPKFFIYNPPAGIKEHEHNLCFQYKGRERGKSKIRVHFNPKPSLEDFSEGIRGVERVLKDVLGNNKR